MGEEVRGTVHGGNWVAGMPWLGGHDGRWEG